MKSFMIQCMYFTSFITLACGGDDKKDVTSKDVGAYVYKGDCNIGSCPAAPTTAAESVVECSKGSNGACGWSDGSDIVGSDGTIAPGGSGGTGGTGSDGVTSFEYCSEAECGPVPAIGCAAGFEQSVICGKENGGKCANVVVCIEKPTNTPCPESKCGPVPELARDCPSNGTSVAKCVALKSGSCTWNFSCASVNEPTGK